MKKYAYLNRLEELLAELPTEQRQAILQEYREAFDAAEGDREEAICDELGTPEEVATRVLQGKEEVPEAPNPLHKILLFVLALALLLVLAFSLSALGSASAGATSPSIQSAGTQESE